MKKILVVVPDFELGGVTVSAINFCNELLRRGNDVSFLNMGRHNTNNLRLFEKDVKFLSLEKKQKYWNLSIRDIKQAKGIKIVQLILLGIIKRITNRKGKWLRIIFSDFEVESNYDVAIAYKQCAPCYYFVLNNIKAKKKIAYIHGDINFMGEISSWDVFFQEFDYLACVSNAVRQGFVNRYPMMSEKFKTVYNMLDVEGIRLKSKEKCPIDIDPSKLNLVTIARNENNHKQVDWIPQICSKLKAQTNNEFCWYVIGDGPDLEYNQKKAKELQVDDRIIFLGALWNPYTILAVSDMLVLTSKTESYGMVVVEAGVLKIPVVSTYYPALKEVLEDGKTGIISEQSIDDLTDKIKKMIENDDNRLENIRQYLENIVITNDLACSQFFEMLKKD